jgi:nucleoid-associated protein YgaU
MANQEIANLKEQLSNKVSDNIYIVKKNDSPCKISRKLYGTESRYKEIEAIITRPLQPGDTLFLK